MLLIISCFGPVRKFLLLTISLLKLNYKKKIPADWNFPLSDLQSDFCIFIEAKKAIN